MFSFHFLQTIYQNFQKIKIQESPSKVAANSAHNANLPFVLVKDGYTEKSEKEIKHDELISNFIGFEKIIEKYL